MKTQCILVIYSCRLSYPLIATILDVGILYLVLKWTLVFFNSFLLIFFFYTQHISPKAQFCKNLSMSFSSPLLAITPVQAFPALFYVNWSKSQAALGVCACLDRPRSLHSRVPYLYLQLLGPLLAGPAVYSAQALGFYNWLANNPFTFVSSVTLDKWFCILNLLRRIYLLVVIRIK